jgi:hypothetical protein
VGLAGGISPVKYVPMNITMRRHRFTRADWIGYAVLIMAGGAVGLVALFLPWANEYTRQSVNFSLSKPPGVVGVLETQWGPPVLAAALGVVAAAMLLLLLGPRRVSAALSIIVVVAGAVYALEAIAAADSMVKMYRPGMGLYVTLLTGILLVPIGLASLAVGAVMRRASATAPPAPGSAPPS